MSAAFDRLPLNERRRILRLSDQGAFNTIGLPLPPAEVVGNYLVGRVMDRDLSPRVPRLPSRKPFNR
jgi:hypothetical protein